MSSKMNESSIIVEFCISRDQLVSKVVSDVYHLEESVGWYGCNLLILGSDGRRGAFPLLVVVVLH